jgi:hypothetical protein
MAETEVCPICGGRLVQADSSDDNPDVIYCEVSAGDHYRSDVNGPLKLFREYLDRLMEEREIDDGA